MEAVFFLLAFPRVLVPLLPMQEQHEHCYAHKETAKDGSRAVDQAARGQV